MKIFDFISDLSDIQVPEKINNPFGASIPKIARIAALEFQDFISSESKKWNYDFHAQKGKMFGVLVVQKNDNNYGYLGAVSGKLPANEICEQFVPSVFDVSVGDYFINKGMTELTEMGKQIRKMKIQSDSTLLKERRKQKSIALQHRLFENYNFINLSGKKNGLLGIFKDSLHGYPPTATGECAAPKLLHYAIHHELEPIAIAEFWWGKTNKEKDKEHKAFYPACKDRCRPILEFVLEDDCLFESRNESRQQ